MSLEYFYEKYFVDGIILKAQVFRRRPGRNTAQLKLGALVGGPLLVCQLLQGRVETLGVKLLDHLRRLPEQAASCGSRGGG